MENNILRKIQLIEVEILDVIVNICEKSNIDYFLVGGTLLGAIRHKGFIPWDDDVDIAMPRKQYDKFIKLCLNNLPKEYFLHCKETDKNYWLPFIKIRKNDTIFEYESIKSIDTHKGIYVDIFPLDNANKKTSLFQTIQAYIAKRLIRLIQRKRGVKLEKPTKKMKITLFFFKIFSIKQLSDFRDFIMSLNKNDDSAFFTNLGSNYNYIKQTLIKNNYYTAIEVEFEKKKYKAPKNPDYVLKSIYNNYMELPPKKDRVAHNPVRVKFKGENEIIF